MENSIPVLDHGYIKLITTWGSDEHIISSARMSTGKGFKGWGTPEVPGDEKLLKYLWKNKHTSPFEQCGLSFEVQAPLMVFREWHRHRTQCLIGSTKITCVMPNGVTSNKRTIKEIYDLKYGGVVDYSFKRQKNGFQKSGKQAYTIKDLKVPFRTRVLPNCQSRMLRVLNEETLEFTTAPMQDIWQSGEKDIFEVCTERGTVRASEDHPFFTLNGWKKLKELTSQDLVASLGVVAARERPIPPSLRTGIGVWTSMMRKRLIKPVDTCYICLNKYNQNDLELDHATPVFQNLKLALDETNLRPICLKCHRIKINNEQPNRKGMTHLGVVWTKVRSINYVNREMTYDISVAGIHNNFVANGLVVHNSYNEFSARYATMPDIHYIPTLERIKQSSNMNKQAQGITGLADDASLDRWLNNLLWMQDEIYHHYLAGLDLGIPKEIARINTPISRYSKMTASANLLNWLRFLTLRLSPNAQYEIRQYAEALALSVAEHFPRTYELFKEFSL